MSGDEHQVRLQWGEALLWLAKAETDIAGERGLLAIDLPDLAAFHVQQALEKALKALLVAAAADVRRTHDIEALATLARAHWPDIVASPFPLIAVGQWYVTTRYPGIDEVPPGSAEVLEALEAVASLIAAITCMAPPASLADGETGGA
jgi:HEPN domain-containing protein